MTRCSPVTKKKKAFFDVYVGPTGKGRTGNTRYYAHIRIPFSGTKLYQKPADRGYLIATRAISGNRIDQVSYKKKLVKDNRTLRVVVSGDKIVFFDFI